MKFTWNWLGEFVDLEGLSPEIVADRLTMAGLEVDAVEHTGSDLAGVVAARVVNVESHPNADRLRVCTVEAGPGELHSVVCGAPNVAVGQMVPFARAGATLPGGVQITAGEIRGVASAGMLCSAREIGAAEDDQGLLELPADGPLGHDVAELLGLADIVLELSITPNRGDCLSVLGIAREVAALTGAARRSPAVVPEIDGVVGEDAGVIPISIADPAGCGRYSARLLHGVCVAPSPLWMQARLRAVGIRPINNVVDVTNYVLIERGQPLHAFDADRLPAREITVRRAGPGNRFTTLDGQVRELDGDDIVITSGGVPVALAGVMGGQDSEVVDATTNVLLESAWFLPEAVRRTSKRLGLRSESSYRFERNVDVEGVAAASDRAVELLAAHCSARPSGPLCDAYPEPARPQAIRLRHDRLAALLGHDWDADEVRERLRAFGMRADGDGERTTMVTPPSYRADVTREIDVVEEVARSVGYDQIEATLPACDLGGSGLAPNEIQERSLRRLLAAAGLDEVVTLSFASPAQNRMFPGLVPDRAPVRIRNPLTQDDTEMRLSLLSGLTRVAVDNLAQGAGAFAGFLLSKIFWAGADEYAETLGVGAIIAPRIAEFGVGCRREAWEFADVKGLVEEVLDRFPGVDFDWRRAVPQPAFHPGLTAQVEANGKHVGTVGCLHPAAAEELSLPDPTWFFELDLNTLLDYRPRPVVCEELPRFPVVVRDLALVAEDTFESERVVRFVREWAGVEGLVESVVLFDQYVGAPIPPGRKSLAFSIAYRSRERTLTDAEVNEVHGKLVAALREHLPVEMR